MDTGYRWPVDHAEMQPMRTPPLRSCAVVALLVAVLSTFAPVARGEPVEPGYDIIVVAGQSNAVGRGEGLFTDTFDRWKYNKRLFQVRRLLDENDLPLPGDGDIIAATSDPLDFWDFDPEDTDVVGFSLPFARRYAAEYLGKGRNVIIVPAAKIASKISEWDEIREKECRDDSVRYYPDMVRRIDIALAQPGVNRIVAFHWAQGESDIEYAIAALGGHPHNPDCLLSPEAYGLRLAEFFVRVRARYPTQNFPIIVGEPVRDWIDKDPHYSRAQQKLKAAFVEQMKLVAAAGDRIPFADARGLKANKPNGAHFDAASQIKLGTRRFVLYRKYRRLVD